MRVTPYTKTNDHTVRAKLAQELLRNKDTKCVIHEFDVIDGKARADVVAISNGRVNAYEIKSDADNLLRLSHQVKYYNQVFYTVTLVVGAEHVVGALYMIPDWWGVQLARMTQKGVVIIPIRKAKENPNLNFDELSNLLSKQELIELLKKYRPGLNYGKMSKGGLLCEVKKEVSSEMLLHHLPNLILDRETRISHNSKPSLSTTAMW